MKDENNNIFNIFLISLSLLPKKGTFIFPLTFTKSPYLILIPPVVQKSLFKLTFDFDLFPSAPVVITYGNLLISNVHHDLTHCVTPRSGTRVT